MKIQKFRAPNTYFFIVIIMAFVAILTWLIPGGQYLSDPANTQLKTFHFIQNTPQGIWAFLTAPIRGFVDAAQIIGFVLLVGGAFGVFQKTEALDTAIKELVLAQQKRKWLQKSLLPIITILFSLGGAVFGMSEEVIPFILLLIPLAIALGYDSITGVAIAYVGAHTGFAAAFLNPFTVGVAQNIAGVPLFSGVLYRIIVWLIFTFITVLYIYRYAGRIKKHPETSPVFENDLKLKKEHHWKTGEADPGGLDFSHKLVLTIFVLSMVILVFGVLYFKWYIDEIAALFLVMGVTVGIAGKLNANEIAKTFIGGAKDLVGTALIIGLARGVLIIAKDGQIIDTILYTLSRGIDTLHPIIASQMMFVVQTFINFFVPSGSGQAALTMPIMAPLSDLIGVSRQTAVLAFQFGDGFSNMIIPTSPVLMGVLALAKISYEDWFKWILKLQLVFFIAGCLLLIPPYYLGW